MSVNLNFFRPIAISAGTLVFALSAFADPKFDNNIDKTFSVAPGSELEVSADMGAIHLTPGADDRMIVHVLRHIEGGNQKDADEWFANHEVAFTQQGNNVSIVGKAKTHNKWKWNSGKHYLQVTYEITAPKRFNMELSTAGGDITMEDLDGTLNARTSSGKIRTGSVTGLVTAKNAGGDIFIKEGGKDVEAGTSSGMIEIQKAAGKVEASNAGGDIRLGEISENVTAHTSSGSITIASANGDCDVTDAGGDIHIIRADGRILAHTSSGVVKLGNAGGDVEASNAGGDIHIDTANGNVAIETSSGRIEIGTAKGLHVKAENRGGNVDILEASGEIDAKTSSGSITIGSAGGSVKAQNSGGDIAIENARGNADVRTSSGSIRIGKSQGRIDARNSGGSIKLANSGEAVNAETSSGAIELLFLAPPKEDCRLSVSSGGITVSLPTVAKLDLDAVSQGGSVNSELPITVEGRSQDGSLKGQLNGGGPKFSLHCSSGDIRLKRSSAIEVRADAGTTR